MDQRFGRADQDKAAALDRSAGIWELEEDGESYVDALRRGRWRFDDTDG